MFGKKVVSWHYVLHAIEKKILSRTASTQPPKNQILWCENFLNSSPKNWVTNWGIQKFLPWRPLKIEKKVFGKKVVSWHYVLHAIEKKILSRTASTHPPKNQILWCENFLNSSPKNWVTNWGIWPFLPWRPLKIEKKVVNINIRSWHYALNAIDQSLLSQTASTQPPKNQILWCKNFLNSSTKH